MQAPQSKPIDIGTFIEPPREDEIVPKKMGSKEYAVISFDLDDTLVRYCQSPETVLNNSFEQLGIEPIFSAEDYYARFDEYVSQYESLEQARSECFAMLAASERVDSEIGRTVAEVFEEQRDHTNVELLPSAKSVLDDCSARYRLAIVTNGPRAVQSQKINGAGIGEYFETIVFAGDDTPPKPDARPFQDLLESLQVSAHRTIHIGDSPGTDIAGARSAGIDSVLVSESQSSANHCPTYQVGSLSELSSLPWLEIATPD